MEDIEVDFSDLTGKTIIKVVGGVQDEVMKIITKEGYIYTLWHETDCCENVYIEDITGDVTDILGHKVLVAEEISQDNPYASESGTWTFYKIRTDNFIGNGNVVIRWNGESNGYYSESVSISRRMVGE